MTTVVELEKKVENLPKEELAEFRNWFLDFEAKVWDKQIEEDSRRGKLDAMASEAIKDFSK